MSERDDTFDGEPIRPEPKVAGGVGGSRGRADDVAGNSTRGSVGAGTGSHGGNWAGDSGGDGTGSSGGSRADAGGGRGPRSRWWLWTGVGVVAFIALLFGGALWVINTESGTRWAANRAVGFLGGKLEIREITGTIAGPLTVSGVRWNDPDSGADVRVARATLDAALMELLSRRVHVLLVNVTGVDVRLSEPRIKDEEKKPFSLTPPIDLLLDSLTLKDAKISRDGRELFVIRAAEAGARWTKRDGIVVQKLALDSPDGNVHLTAQVAGGDAGADGGDRADDTRTTAPRAADNTDTEATIAELSKYTARLTGGFRWKVADAQYVGDLTATSANRKLTAQVRLSEPFGARLDATVEETSALPWQLTLAVPQFDPRDGLLPDSSIESLATNLRAHGDLTFAELRGDVAMNGQAVRIEPARIRYKEQVLTIETLTLLDPRRRGSLTANGEVRFGDAASAAATSAASAADASDATSPRAAPRGAPGEPSAPTTTQPDSNQPPPLYANLNVNWKDVELPREWVGQPLNTHGEIKVDGTPARFAANGDLAIGPPGHLAAINLDIKGTPEQIQIQRFSIVQKAGNLTATGNVLLKPRIGWQLNARARAFNPGELVAGWPGNLGFALDTKGELLEKGLNASLNLQNLAGTLRGRPLAGQAALTVNPNKVVAGTLDVRSGRSSVSLTGRGGTSMNVDTQFDIASLDDWVPKAAGRLNGKFHIAGTWPRLAINGKAAARDLAYGEYSLKAIDVAADVQNPQSPSGSTKITASTIIAAGFEFSQVDLDASGDEKAHTVHLKATGQPLSTQINVQGARAGPDGWAGTVDQLDLAVTGISPLALREPVKVNYNPRTFSVSRSCLAGDQLSACVSAAQNEAGELNAEYTLEHLPLGLVAAIAAPNMPVHIEAVIEGNGNFRRTKDGALFGEAHVSSNSGRITEAGAEPREEAADALLTYENLKLDAQLSGETAQGTLSSSLNNGGTLSGDVQLANLSGAAPTLDGKAKLSIPDLSPVGLFVPQLANVKGAGEANVQVTGTIAEPQITGTAQLRNLAAEVPQVGIKLRDGQIDASMRPGNDIELTGKLSSGKGELAINGTTLDNGLLRVKAQGKEFQAADMPGANVIVDPDLTFERSPEHMLLYGQVRIPRAAIDLSKLPKQEGGTSASPDVVVVDDDEAVEQSKNVPLEVNVGLIIGKPQNNNTLVGFEDKDTVNLIGYGLNAKVDGWLDVHERPGEPTTGNGEIHLTGLYKAYGQDLTIEQGRLLFAGQQITDPQVNIVATRTVEAVKAKLTVSGSASKPQLEVSADPTMSQTQALSYLVTGKPINEVGSGEGDLVQSAARSLGGAAGNLLAKGLGQRLGISQIGVEDNDEIGGSAFTVGQYLSPRLYLSYGVGLFEPGQVVTLRYRINDKLSLEAAQGPLNQKAGINYRIERK